MVFLCIPIYQFHNNLLEEDYAEKLILNIFSAIEKYFTKYYLN